MQDGGESQPFLCLRTRRGSRRHACRWVQPRSAPAPASKPFQCPDNPASHTSKPVFTQMHTRAHSLKTVASLVRLFVGDFPFYFVLSETNLKIISTWLSEKMANPCTFQQKQKPCFDLPKNSVLRLHKAQYRNRHYGSERSRGLHMCHPKPRIEDIPDGKTTKHA